MFKVAMARSPGYLAKQLIQSNLNNKRRVCLYLVMSNRRFRQTKQSPIFLQPLNCHAKLGWAHRCRLHSCHHFHSDHVYIVANHLYHS